MGTACLSVAFCQMGQQIASGTLPTMSWTGLAKTELSGPWLGNSVDWSVIPVRQHCRSIPGRGTCKKQPNECMRGWNSKLIYLSIHLSVKSIYIFKN